MIATWWVGLILGVALGIVSRAGNRPKISAGNLVRPLAVLLTTMGLLAAVAGVVGHLLASRRQVLLVGGMKTLVPPERHVAFLTDLWIHNASYGAGFIGGITLCVWAYRRRTRLAQTAQA